MDTHEQWIHEIKLAKLREQLHTGISQLDQGLGIPVGSKTELDAIFSEIQGNPKA
jgi:antitoxin ParD1/3/4